MKITVANWSDDWTKGAAENKRLGVDYDLKHAANRYPEVEVVVANYKFLSTVPHRKVIQAAIRQYRKNGWRVTRLGLGRWQFAAPS